MNAVNVLLSIRPRYVDRIKDGTKRYEFRKAIFKEPGRVERVHIYSSSPVRKIVGSFAIDGILEGHPRDLWERCNDAPGIDEEGFFRYFEGKERGFAIRIKDLEIFSEPVDPRSVIDGFRPPQSYRYVGTIP